MIQNIEYKGIKFQTVNSKITWCDNWAALTDLIFSEIGAKCHFITKWVGSGIYAHREVYYYKGEKK